ncbi:restriction system-associated AAA family ATPase [Desulfogranum japonicum]|uniref:restriction system-associated AAA family ATPase n=1 Tax=Desulfogranum japonicum TaxID=231447 RepID=UPI000401391C|nr:restriction system-associated AAA family ATPase [Desulfogranum japonicum]
MKLLRLKITDPKGFRSLQAGFEYRFRSEWDLQEEQGFAPFVCAGPNGSGKSNLLEVLAAIFYHLECIYLYNLPESFKHDDETNPNGFRAEMAQPDAFELEYVLPIQDSSELGAMGMGGNARIKVIKQAGEGPKWFLVSGSGDEPLKMTQTLGRQLLPDYVLGYSSGENEILSLPFFKMRFVQFDEYDQALKQQLPYPGRPESRLVYLDSGFSQAILLCNLLFQDTDVLTPFSDDVKIEELREFRIIIRRSIEVEESQIPAFGSRDENKRESIKEIVKNHPALSAIEDESQIKRYRVNLVQLLDGSDTTDKVIPCLMRCATCWYLDEASDTLTLDYRVNDATRQAFRENFDFELNRSPIALFQAFQVLLTLNLFAVSDSLKADLYQSESHYVSETVPTLASDERIMRFKFVKFRKTDVAEPVMLKNLSDGEHQLLHTLGLCLLFKNTQSLFLLDEPETHFNPDWRANFITRLHQSFNGSDHQEMLVTTHTPFLISDSRPEKVLVFNKAYGVVSVSHPDYNTLGASINKITMATFGKRETIGGFAQGKLQKFRQDFEEGKDRERLIAEINRQLGDSVEKVLLIKTILDSMEGQD